MRALPERPLRLATLLILVLGCLPCASQVQSLAFGETRRGAVEARAEVDVYSILPEGEAVLYVWCVAPPGSGLRPGIELLGPAGESLAKASGSIGAEIRRIKIGASAHTLLVRGDAGSTGGYAVTVIRLDGPNPGDEPHPALVHGTTITNLVEEGDLDVFEIEVAQAESVSMVAAETQWGLFEPALVVLDPLGREVLVQTHSQRVFTSPLRLGIAGTYRIIISDLERQPGECALTVYRHPGPNANEAGEGRLIPMTSSKGWLSAGDVDLFWTEMVEGEQINLQLERVSGNISAAFAVYAPDGQLVQGAVRVSTAAMKAPSTGYYLVACYDTQVTSPLLGTRSGEYSLFFSTVPSQPNRMLLGSLYTPRRVTLYWPDEGPDWKPQFMDPETGGSWTDLMGRRVVMGGLVVFEVTSVPPQRLFRVVQP